MTVDLKNTDIEFLLDKSKSMEEPDCGSSRNKPRWGFAQEITVGLARDCQVIDADGITVVPFAGKFSVYESVTADKVAQVFTEHSPGGSTDTAAVLKNRLDAHFARRAAGSTKSTCLLVLTDGAPDDQNEVARVIVEATKLMTSDDDLAISFIQIGHDAKASEFLRFLDDDLVTKCGAVHDIVDTVKIGDVEDFKASELIQKAFAD